VTARILALDLTGPGGGAALLLPAGLTLSRLPPGAPRGRLLMPAVQALLAAAHLSPRDLDAVACAVGPGSFTGIRIGIATAATLAYAAGIPTVGVGSMHGLAENAPTGACEVAVALDARRGHVYGARFRRSGGPPEALGGYVHCLAAEFAASLAPGTWVLGDARRAYPESFGSFPGDADIPVRPDVIARIGADRFAQGETIPCFELRPLYLRLSDPEIRFPARP